MLIASVANPTLPWDLTFGASYEWRTAKQDNTYIPKQIAEVEEIANGVTNPEALVRICRTSGRQFLDLAFPPTEKALCNNHQVQWRRPQEYIERPSVPLIFDNIEPAVIVPGSLDDIHFVCSLALLAEKPDAVRHLLPLHSSDMRQGVFRVRLCHDGWWDTIVIDSLFPCDPETGLPTYSTTQGGAQWVNIIEKAYAKRNGSYYKIMGGSPATCLTSFTGFPCLEIRLHGMHFDADEAWNTLQACIAAGYFVCASIPEEHFEDGGHSSPPHIVKEENELVGLVAEKHGFLQNHTYCVLDVVQYQPESNVIQYDQQQSLSDDENEGATATSSAPTGAGGPTNASPGFFPNPNTQPVRLVKLRNVGWAKSEWAGDWSCSSEKWTEHAKRTLDYNTTWTDKTFFIPYDSFQRLFVSVTACYYKPQWEEVRVKCNFGKAALPDTCVELKHPHPGPVHVILSQPERRTANGWGDYTYQCCGIFILAPAESTTSTLTSLTTASGANINAPGGYTFHAYSGFKDRKEVWLTTELPGSKKPYLIVPTAFSRGTTWPFVLTIQAPSITAEDCTTLSMPREVIEKCELATCMALGIEKLVTRDTTIRLLQDGKVCIVAVVNSSTHVWSVLLDFRQSIGWECHNGLMEFEMEVPPNTMRHVCTLYNVCDLHSIGNSRLAYIVQHSRLTMANEFAGEMWGMIDQPIRLNPSCMRLATRQIQVNGAVQPFDSPGKDQTRKQPRPKRVSGGGNNGMPGISGGIGSVQGAFSNEHDAGPNPSGWGNTAKDLPPMLQNQRPRTNSLESRPKASTPPVSLPGIATVRAIGSAPGWTTDTTPKLEVMKPSIPSQIENDVSGEAVTPEQLREMFDAFDKNKNGFLSRTEFKKMYALFEDYGLDRGETTRKELFAKYDDGDDRLDFDEFCLLMLQRAKW
eukprot:TRINITY_DN67861_c5_g1_i1.p1 TRINITY_DN67861_c5_g1~~TRINITY_DN67861_c5_g1_i1.p1  ORF type:complete len:1016 (-),score=56.74 TRINITY_DN67861_c5_g1_i1:957-3713(-)